MPRETDNDIPFAIGHYAFATLYKWTDFQIKVKCASRNPKKLPNLSVNIKYHNTYIVEWFRNELNKTHKEEQKEGWLVYDFIFKRPLSFQFDNGKIRITRIAICARRSRITKTKFLRCEGDAIYDWQNKNWVLPPKGWLSFGTIDTHEIDNWEDAKDGIPKVTSGGISINLYGYERMTPANPKIDFGFLFRPCISMQDDLEKYFDQN